MLVEDLVIEIVSAEYVKDYQLFLLFTDGKKRTVDFEPFLKNSSNPLIRKYLDLEKFMAFSLAFGDLMWNDYDLCFPIADLYDGHI